METSSGKLYWEDFPTGFVAEFGNKLVTKEEIIDFARQFDPQFFHVDEEAAKDSFLGGLCASGWHIGGMAHRMISDRFLLNAECLGSPGMEKMRLIKPVYAGDRLRMRLEILDTRLLNKYKGAGMTTCRWELFNQDDEMVMQLDCNIIFGRRDKDA